MWGITKRVLTILIESGLQAAGGAPQRLLLWTSTRTPLVKLSESLRYLQAMLCPGGAIVFAVPLVSGASRQGSASHHFETESESESESQSKKPIRV